MHESMGMWFITVQIQHMLLYQPTTNYQLPTTNYQLPTTNYQLPTTTNNNNQQPPPVYGARNTSLLLLDVGCWMQLGVTECQWVLLGSLDVSGDMTFAVTGGHWRLMLDIDGCVMDTNMSRTPTVMHAKLSWTQHGLPKVGVVVFQCLASSTCVLCSCVVLL